MSKIKLLVGLFALLLMPVGVLAGDFVTKSGRFVLTATDDVNLNADGSIIQKPGFTTGVFIYRLSIVKESDNSEVFKKDYVHFNLFGDNVVDMTGEVKDEGSYLMTVTVVNKISPFNNPQEFYKPPIVVHNLTFEMPEPTPTPTPVPPTPTPTPVPEPLVPEPLSDSVFSFQDLPVNETDMGNETPFGGGGGSNIQQILERLR